MPSGLSLPFSRLLPSLSRATPSAVSEHFSELLGCPISRSLTTYCVRLELRSRPSPGIARLHRYNGPLRLPRAPNRRAGRGRECVGIVKSKEDSISKHTRDLREQVDGQGRWRNTLGLRHLDNQVEQPIGVDAGFPLARFGI